MKQKIANMSKNEKILLGIMGATTIVSAVVMSATLIGMKKRGVSK